MVNEKRVLGLKKEEFLYIAIISGIYLILNLYYISFYPIYIDEAFTFVNFTSKGIINSLTEYPEPNNHVLFSLISNLFYHFPFSSIINLRLPNILLGLSTSVLFYLFLKKLFNHTTAIIPHIILTFSYVLTFYSVFARGYMLIIFFTLVCAICLYKISCKYELKYLVLFSICSILGFLSVPIFLYVYASLFIYLIGLYWRKKINNKQLLMSNVSIVIFTTLLYLPIILKNGLGAITNNKFTQKIDRSEVVNYVSSHWKVTFDKLLGVNSGYLFLILSIVIVLIALKEKNRVKKNAFLIIPFTFILPLFFMVIHSVIPGTRTWCYLIIPLSIGVSIIIDNIAPKIKFHKFVYYSIGLTILIVQIHIFKKSHPRFAHPYDSVGQIISKKVISHNYHTFYFDFEEVLSEQIFIEYMYLSNEKKTETKNKTTIPLNLSQYDCLIYRTGENKKRKALACFKIIHKDNSIIIYGK